MNFLKLITRGFFYEGDNGAGGGGAGGGSAGGAGSGGAGAGAGDPGAAGGGQATPPDWTTGFSDEDKGYLTNKGFKQPGELLHAHRSLEKTFGVPRERLLVKPEKEDDATAMGEFYNKLGRPGTPDDYQLDLPKEGVDADFTKWAKDSFHKHGLTKKQAADLAKDYMQFSGGRVQAQQQDTEKQLQAAEATLRKEWGAAYDQNKEIAQRACTVFGVTQDAVEKLEKSLGIAESMKLFQKIGARLGEDTFVSNNRGGQGFGIRTPAAAKAEIAGLRTDTDFQNKLFSGDAAAKERWENLHKWAFPDGQTT